MQMIHDFEATKTIPDLAERNTRRNALLDQIYDFVQGVKGIAVDKLISDIEHWGEVASFLIVMLAKLNGVDCFEGSLLTDERLAQVLNITAHSSGYLRGVARKLVGSFIRDSDRVFNAEQKERIVLHLIGYSLDDKFGYGWVWEGLVRLCPLKEDAFVGSMVGQCVGDALGFIVEGQRPDVCRRYIEEFVLKEDVPTWVRIQGLTFGQYSDDSQLARETYVTMVQADGRMDPAVFGNRIGGLFQPGHYRIVGYGATTAKAGEALYMGKHYSKTGSKTTSGNGSAMRSVPVGLIMSQRPLEELKQVARVFSSVTHASEACMDGSVAMAVAGRICMATRGIVFDCARFLTGVAAHVSDEGYKAEILRLLHFTSDDQAKAHVIDYGKRMGEDQWSDGVSPGVRQSTLWALYSFCKYPGDFTKCIAMAISCGGDVDTTAAMAGALSGARLGFEAVPKVWRDTIHDLNVWKLKDVCELVKEVFTMVK